MRISLYGMTGIWRISDGISDVSKKAQECLRGTQNSEPHLGGRLPFSPTQRSVHVCQVAAPLLLSSPLGLPLTQPAFLHKGKLSHVLSRLVLSHQLGCNIIFLLWPQEPLPPPPPPKIPSQLSSFALLSFCGICASHSGLTSVP